MTAPSGEFLLRVGLREGTISSDSGLSTYVDFRVYALPLAWQPAPVAAFEAVASDFDLMDFSRESIVAAFDGAGTCTAPSHMGPVLCRVAPPGSLIWLQIEDGSGYLPAFPWESLLWSIGNYRSIRKTAVPIAAVPPRGTLDAVLCFCCGDERDGAAELVKRFFDMLPTPARRARIHLFADHLLRPYLEANVEAADRRGFDFAIYYPDPERDLFRDKVFPLASPWLTWMQAVLKPYAIDFVHVIADGEIGLESGNLTFASAIDADDLAYRVPVGPRGFERFLRSIGAWSASFSSPPGNPSPTGLRFFTHLLAQYRSGPVVLHDMVRDPRGADLLGALRFFAVDVPYPGSASTILYKNPDTVVDEAPVPTELLDDPDEANAASWLRLQRHREAVINAIQSEHDPLRRETKLRVLDNVTGALREGLEHNDPA